MHEPLGLSIGTTNFVAARNGSPPVTRRAVLTLFPHRAPEIGLPAENPNLTEAGTVVSGFVERIGDSVEMFSADGSSHDPELLLVEALDAMISVAGADMTSSEITIAVPSHWGPEALRSLRNGLRTHAGFVRSGLAPRLVSDALAALNGINATSGLPSHGLVGLIDFGGGGTNITVADAASDFAPIDKTLRYWEFSGEQVDQALLAHVVDGMGHAGNVDPAATGAVGPLAQLKEECRQAKERLSTDTVTELAVDFSGYRSSVQITRAELESLIQERLSGVLATFDDLLARHKIDWADLATVVTVGGGASIPRVAQCVSSHTRRPVITAAQPAFSMAVGAAMFASREPAVEEAPASTAMAAAITGGTTGISQLPPADVLLDEDDSETPRKLAWSEYEDTGNEPVPYTGAFYGGNGNDNGNSRLIRYAPVDEPADYRRPGRSPLPRLVFGLAALVAMIAIGGVVFSLSSTVEHKVPTQPTSSKPVTPPPPTTSAAPPPPPSSSAAPPPPSSAAPPPPSSAAPSLSLIPPPSVAPSPSSPAPPPPPPSSPPPPPPPPVTTTDEAPPPTTTTQPTTTAPPTTTATTTMATPPPTPTSTTTTVPMTTEYLTVPFVPIPIPIQVPQKQGDSGQP
jgi:hypothetical protein